MIMKTPDKLREIFNEWMELPRGEGSWIIYGKKILTPEGRKIRNLEDAQRTLFYHYDAVDYQ